KHTNRYISPILTQKVFANMRRIGKEAQILAQGDDVQEHAEEEVATDVFPPTPTSPSPSSPVIPSSPPHQSPSPPQPQAAEGSSHVFQQLRRLKNVGTSQRVESSDDVENVFNQGRISVDMETDEGGRISVDMETDEGVELVVDQEKNAEVEGRQADKQAEIYNIDLDHSSKVLSMQEDDTEVQEAVEVVTTAKLITEVVTAAATQVVAASTPISAAKPKVFKIVAASTPISAAKPKEELDKEHEEAYKQIDWNATLDHVQAKEPHYIKRYHGIKKKPQSESEARKNMISYLKNTEGYKMEFFKGKTYDQILPIFQA
nr:hypothetical protein [Tanacetum cinerariifolium]